MTSEEAYHIIGEFFKCSRTQRFVESSFDETNFGNFIIKFADETGERCVICDRGEIVLCDDFSGTKDCRSVLLSLYEVSKPMLLEALKLELPSSK